jgi:colanic acid/amylovoran biosynthesis glycosyltransferase
MRIIYVTACIPYGPAETFIIGEIAELLRRNEVLVVPRSPGELGQHAPWLAEYTVRESLLSWRVLGRALRVSAVMPGRVKASARVLVRAGSMGNAVRNLAVFPKALWLACVATQWKADHIHCHWAGTTATMAMVASELSGIPWSLTAHRSDIVSNNLLADKARSATMVRTIAREGLNMMAERGVEVAEKVRVLPMGVPIPKAVPRNLTAEKVVLCPADLLEVKGHRFLIAAWKLLSDRGIKARLWLAGSGELRPSLQKLTGELGLSDSVSFLGTISHEKLLDLYRAGTISAVVLASIDLGGGCHEGIPVALVEAMSFGIPVVSTTTGGIPELVQPGTGFLVPPKDPAALAEAIQDLLQDEVLSEMIGQSGREWVMETRDIEMVAARLESQFRSSRAVHHAVAVSQ